MFQILLLSLEICCWKCLGGAMCYYWLHALTASCIDMICGYMTAVMLGHCCPGVIEAERHWRDCNIV